MKLPKRLKATTVNLAIPEGKIAVDAHMIGEHFCIHPELIRMFDDGGGFVACGYPCVSHVPTGFRVRGVGTWREAKAVALALSAFDCIDWSRKGPTYYKRLKKPTRDAIRATIDAAIKEAR